MTLLLHEDEDFDMSAELEKTNDLNEWEMNNDSETHNNEQANLEQNDSDTDDDEPLANTFPLWQTELNSDDLCRQCLKQDAPISNSSMCDNWVQCRECKTCEFFCMFVIFFCAVSQFFKAHCLLYFYPRVASYLLGNITKRIGTNVFMQIM